MEIIFKGVSSDLLRKIEKKTKLRRVVFNHRGGSIDIEIKAGKKATREFLEKCRLI